MLIKIFIEGRINVAASYSNIIVPNPGDLILATEGRFLFKKRGFIFGRDEVHLLCSSITNMSLDIDKYLVPLADKEFDSLIFESNIV